MIFRRVLLTGASGRIGTCVRPGLRAELDELRLTDVRAPDPPPPAATLRDLLGTAPSLADVGHAIFCAVKADDPNATPLEIDQPLLAAQSRLARHFADPAWTWRR